MSQPTDASYGRRGVVTSACLLEALERSKGELLAKPATSPTETLSEVQQWLCDQKGVTMLTPACRYYTRPVNPWAHDWDLCAAVACFDLAVIERKESEQ
jgi:hypothetical protein